jgi:Arylsulfotransferase (ASST).
MGHPSIYPTGVTAYNRDKAYNGYTVYPSSKGAVLIDMNGNIVHRWAGLYGNPNKILPGGYILGSTGLRNPQFGAFNYYDLVQVDWQGKIIWKFDKDEYITDPGEEPRFMARQNHDFQREGSATGYYSPGSEPLTSSGNTLIVVGENVYNPNISRKVLLDSKIIEVTWEGKIVWEWRANEHFDELGFDAAAKKVLYDLYSPDVAYGGQGYWLAINNINTLGPNKWYDAGDERFHPDNIIWDGRNANILAIISKKTGKIVWKLGPDFNESDATRKLGWVIGQHHLHLIQKGLPGEGNLLFLDNGGFAGYGRPTGTSSLGSANQRRDYSRVLELDPTTLEIKWQYTPKEAGHIHPLDSYKFFTSFMGSVQRLPNGNTLITEASDGRLIEVTAEHETVWEYVNPFFEARGLVRNHNHIYRAYRVPYEWIPQLKKPQETSITPPNISKFRVPGAPDGAGAGKITIVQGVDPKRLKPLQDPYAKVQQSDNVERDFCIVPIETSASKVEAQ